MKTYARIENGLVVEIIPPLADDDGNEIAIADRFHPDIAAQLVDITDVPDVTPGDVVHDDGTIGPAMPPVLTIEQQIAANTKALQDAMDERARLKGYDNIMSACIYATNPPGTPFQAEGAAYSLWRAQVWASAFAVLAEVRAGDRAMPTPEEAVEMMPELVLP